MRRRTWVWAAATAAMIAAPTAAEAQDLADFDYENLSLRGIGIEWSYMVPTRVEATDSWGVRFDLGYLGPGLRIVPSVSYWQAPFKDSEVEELEANVASLIADQTGQTPPRVELGQIFWYDVVIGVDAQVMWSVPFNVLTFAGIGGSAHILDGFGHAVDGTFVEDLLDSVTAGFNFHAGIEYPFSRRFRMNGQARYEIMGDLQYFQTRIGAQYMIGDNAPGEGRN